MNQAMHFGPVTFAIFGFIALYIGGLVGSAMKDAEARKFRKRWVGERRLNDSLLGLIERERGEREISEVRRVS
jgi:hypothetical protein